VSYYFNSRIDILTTNLKQFLNFPFYFKDNLKNLELNKVLVKKYLISKLNIFDLNYKKLKNAEVDPL
jgi:hypothetical protein